MSVDLARDVIPLTKRGFHLFPVDSPETETCSGIRTEQHNPATCTQRGKHPCVPFTKAASADPQTVVAQFAGVGPRNVGIATGPSGLVILDEDTPGGLDRYATDHGVTIPPTFTVTTGRGRHYYFHAPPGVTVGNTAGRLHAYGVDVRAGNAYVVGPGSLHSTGTVYTVEQDLDPAPLPGWVLDAIQTRPAALEGAQGGRGGSSLADLPAIICGPRHNRPGERHQTLVRLAASLRARETPPVEAEAVFHAAWARCEQPPQCDTPLPWAEALATLHDVYDRYPPGRSPDHQRVDVHGQPATITSPLDPVDPERAHRGQLRMAYRLAASHVDRLLYVHGIGWHYWDGRRWAEDDRGTARQAVYDMLRAALAESLHDKDLRDDVRRCETAAGVAGVLQLASALPQFAATVADLDTDPYLLNCANGTLDLHTLQLRPHDPADRITKVTRAAWHPDAHSAEWEQFLERVLPDEQVRAFVQRLFGLALLGKVREHLFPIAIGQGSNGKGTLYEAILHMLGDYGHVAPSDLFMATRSNPNAASPAQFDLRGRRLVVVSETERDHHLAMALMKNLTGGDPITARPLYGAPVTFTPSHTPLMVTNFLPKVAGDDPAAWRRIRVIPFDVVIPDEEQDDQLGERLQLAADAILTWAVAGWVDYLEHGMNPPPAVLHATGNYQRDSDAVSRFIDAECLVNPHMYAEVGDLWERFERWRADDGAQDAHEMSKRAFGEALEKRGFAVERITGGVRVRRGLGLQATDQEGSDDGGDDPRVTQVTQLSMTSTRGGT